MNERWLCSLHGGHSGEFCDHAKGTLREVIEAAIARGFTTYGISEHAPRYADHLLYEEERQMGWDVDKLIEIFDLYQDEVFDLAAEYRDRITLLRGFEAEVVPDGAWLPRMSELRERGFDYVVGSVHHVAERSIDGPVENFEDAMTELGGLEALSVAYYDSIGSMVSQFEPDVVGHFDLIRKNGRHFGDVDTPAARAAASQALEVISESGAILDLNSGGYRKGLETPYPAPHFVLEAHSMGIPFCFGDDSHGPADVGRDLVRSRAYLLGLGVTTITSLDRSEAGIARTRIAL